MLSSGRASVLNKLEGDFLALLFFKDGVGRSLAGWNQICTVRKRG